MKTFTKVLVLVLSFAMLLGLAVPAFADTTTTYSITINNDASGYAYAAYQIFKGDLSGTGAAAGPDTTADPFVLSNIEWGDGVTMSGTTATTLGTLADGEAKTPAQWAEWLSANSDKAEDFAAEIAKKLSSNSTSSGAYNSDAKTYTISGLEAGYYLVKNTTVPSATETTGAGSYTSYILKVIGDVTVDTKSDVPKVEKKVKDINDSTDSNKSDWQDSADHDIGDSIDFKLEGTLPSNYEDYTKYKLVFHDEMSDGLTLCEKDDDIKVYVDGVKITTGYTIVRNTDDDCTFEVVFEDLIAANVGAHNGSKITVEYSATLNEHANIGATGNPNEVYLEFSNNPNYKGDGTPDEPDEPGTTPKDKVIVFTYELENTKVDGTDKSTTLKDAEFDLYKWVADGAELPKDWDKTPYTGTNPALATPAGGVSGGKWVKVNKEALKSGNDGKFGYKGLDDGYYAIIETKAPTGYNKLADPIYFTIEATHTEGDAPELTDLVVKDENGNQISEGDSVANPTFTATVETGKVSTTVENNTGSELPSTGALGTTIFCIVGSILVLCTGVLLVTKRRMKGLV